MGDESGQLSDTAEELSERPESPLIASPHNEKQLASAGEILLQDLADHQQSIDSPDQVDSLIGSPQLESQEEAWKTAPATTAEEPAVEPYASPVRVSRRIQSDSEDDREEVELRETTAVSADSNGALNDDDIFDAGNQSDSDSNRSNNGDEVAEEDKNNDDNLMSRIFGDTSDVDEEEGEREEGGDRAPDDEGAGKVVDSDDGEPRFLRVELDSDGEQKEWDFDVMLRKKKAERKKKRKKDGTISLISDADDQVKALVDAMAEAANEDRQSNVDKRPAIQKRKMLQIVRTTLLKSDLFETLLDNGMMNAVSDWLAPLPDKSLPALEVRSSLLKILQSYPNLEQGILKQSGLGKAVMFLFKHPKETRENKTIAAKLIREWSRPIFQLDTDFRSLSREERLQRDYAHMPEAKRKRLSLDDDGLPGSLTSSQLRGNAAAAAGDDEGQTLRPGDVGFILRARVPKPSTKDYVVRPKSLVEGCFQGASKNRTTDRFERTQREFRERNRSQKAKRAVGVSLEGRKMDI